MLSEISQRKQWFPLNVECKKQSKWTNKTEETHRYRELMVAKLGGGEKGWNRLKSTDSQLQK